MHENPMVTVPVTRAVAAGRGGGPAVERSVWQQCVAVRVGSSAWQLLG